jgi:hypothetical protein
VYLIDTNVISAVSPSRAASAALVAWMDRCVVTSIHRDVSDAFGAGVSQQVGSALHTSQLDIAMHGQPEGRRELPVEMEFREGGNSAQAVQIQIRVEMLVDMIQHPPHPGLIVLQCRRHRPSSVAA